MKNQNTEVFEEMLRAPLKTVVRTIGFVKMVVDRSMELARRSVDVMVKEVRMKGKERRNMRIM